MEKSFAKLVSMLLFKTRNYTVCPICQETELTSVKHVKYQRNILALEVRCTMKDRGCEWTGQLQHLDAHLDVATGDCKYVDVECPKKCVQKVQKRNVDTHLANECPNRDYRCPHCNFANKYHVVSTHFDVCPYYPLACPNRCGATFERDDLPDHMKMCRLEEVQCVFGNEGCQANFIRENEDEHMDRNTQKHLALMPAATLRISQDFEQKLQEQQEVFGQKLQEQQEVFEKKFEQKDEQIKRVEQKLQEQQEVFEKKQEQKNKEHKQGLQQLGGQLKEFQEQKDEQMKLQEEKSRRTDKQIENVKHTLQENMKKYKQKQKENDERMQQLGGQLQQKDEQIKQVEQKLDKQSREFQEQLGEQQKEFQEILKEKNEKIKKMEDQLQTNGQVIEQQQQAISQLCRAVGIPPYDITFSNYQLEKARGGHIDSPPMYTHPGGYKFKPKLYLKYAYGTNVAVGVYSLEGDHDATLKFPVKFTITLQLLNQHRNQDHYTRDIQCEVTREMIGSVYSYIGADSTFIPHATLEWNRDKQTQYLKDDCLKFRITKIVF